jgi:hypothetical protein
LTPVDLKIVLFFYCEITANYNTKKNFKNILKRLLTVADSSIMSIASGSPTFPALAFTRSQQLAPQIKRTTTKFQITE